MTQLKTKVTSSASGFIVSHCDLQFDPFWQLGCPARLRYVADTSALWSHTCPFRMFVYQKGVNFFHQIMQEIGHNFVMNHQSPAKEVLLSFFYSEINIFQE